MTKRPHPSTGQGGGVSAQGAREAPVDQSSRHGGKNFTSSQSAASSTRRS